MVKGRATAGGKGLGSRSDRKERITLISGKALSAKKGRFDRQEGPI